MQQVIRALALLGLLVVPASAHGAPRVASARLSVSVWVVRSVVVASRIVATAAAPAPGARELVLDASGAPVPVVVRWEQPRPEANADARWVTVLADGEPAPARAADAGQPGL
jgi:hypothetical protein